MKKLVLKTALFMLIGGFTFTSCQKTELLKNRSESLFNSDEITSSEIEKVVEEDVHEASMKEECNKEHFDDCATITEEYPNGGDFPKVVIIDFGSEGCNGKTGKIIVNISDDMKNAGAERVVTFDNFFRDGNQLQGTKKTTNLGADENGNIQFSEVESTILTQEKGGSVSKNVSMLRTFIAGFDTEDRSDDEFLLFGTEQVQSSEKGSMLKETEEAIHISVECKYPLSGIVSHMKDGKTRTLDFGDGTCDNEAIGTDENGETKTINLDDLPKEGSQKGRRKGN